MRAAGFVTAIVLAVWPAVATARSYQPVDGEPVEPDFWREVIEPHGDEVRVLVTKVRRGFESADEALKSSDAEWAVDQRMRYFEDAFHVMTYARTLSPENPDVLALLGRASDETGRTRQAIEALDACLKVTGTARAPGEVVARLGAIYLRRGDADTAIRYLRMAQGPVRADNAAALVHLANALASRGDVAAAVDVLVTALPKQQVGYYSYELTLVTFALGVVYDRDEQRGAAFEVLDRLKTTLATSFAGQVQSSLALLRYAPAEDQHYYLGLLYEIEHLYVEARAEFAIYAASGETPWRGRALEHVREIDAERRLPRPPPAVAPVSPSTPSIQPVLP